MLTSCSKLDWQGRNPFTSSSSASGQNSTQWALNEGKPTSWAEPIIPIPESKDPKDNFEAAKIALGSRLFRDPVLSGDGKVACLSCHLAKFGGSDGRKKPYAREKNSGALNATTIYNLAYNDSYNWSGRFRTLEEQLDAPVVGPLLMATTWVDIVKRLSASSDYVASFAQVYPDGITVANVKVALAAYERSLTTPGARFDRYLRGDKSAITEEELQGYELFKSYGCATCHQGINVGGNLFQKFGIMRDYFKDRGNETEEDLGRYTVTKQESDKYVFRVPSLRNVELTAPYFHDGSAETLEQAVRVMSVYQLGKPLSARSIGMIVAFLKTLTAPVGPGDL